MGPQNSASLRCCKVKLTKNQKWVLHRNIMKMRIVELNPKKRLSSLYVKKKFLSVKRRRIGDNFCKTSFSDKFIFDSTTYPDYLYSAYGQVKPVSREVSSLRTSLCINTALPAPPGLPGGGGGGGGCTVSLVLAAVLITSLILSYKPKCYNRELEISDNSHSPA